MFKYYRTSHDEDDQYLLYDKEKDYGFFFNKWGAYGKEEQNSFLCNLKVSQDNFLKHFNKYIKDIKDARRELLKNIM